MDTRGMIEITGIDLLAFVKACYARSRPQGMGALHYIPGDLDDETAAAILANDKDGGIAVSLDYVHGRAVKMVVWREDTRLFIRNEWFDHSRALLAAALTACGLDGERLVEGAVAEAAAS